MARKTRKQAPRQKTLEEQREELQQRYEQGRQQLAVLQRQMAQIEGAVLVLTQMIQARERAKPDA